MKTGGSGKQRPLAIVAMGGHAFLGAGERGTIEDHVRNAQAISSQLMTLVERDYDLVITHGNGPQVGNLLLKNELVGDAIPKMPLDVLVADKDLTSSILGAEIEAELLIILTDVPRVYLNYGKENQQGLSALTMGEARQYLSEGHFAGGSMEPKVRAILQFLQQGGRRGLITSPQLLSSALDGEQGTHFVGRV